jgi:hypothetical protein
VAVGQYLDAVGEHCALAVQAVAVVARLSSASGVVADGAAATLRSACAARRNTTPMRILNLQGIIVSMMLSLPVGDVQLTLFRSLSEVVAR